MIEVLAFMIAVPNNATRAAASLLVIQNFGRDKAGAHIELPAEDADHIVEDLQNEAHELRSEGSVVRFISRLGSLI